MEGGPRGNRDILDDLFKPVNKKVEQIKINLNKTADEIVESNITPLTFKKFVRFDKGQCQQARKRRIQKSQIENHEV